MFHVWGVITQGAYESEGLTEKKFCRRFFNENVLLAFTTFSSAFLSERIRATTRKKTTMVEEKILGALILFAVIR